MQQVASNLGSPCDGALQRVRRDRGSHPRVGRIACYRFGEHVRDRRNIRLAVKRGGEVFGYDTVAATMINHLVDQTEFISIKGGSFGIKDHDRVRSPPPSKTE